MNLISQLNEAANVPLDQLLPMMKKDKRVSKIFTRDPQLDEFPDLETFKKTLNYYFFNNERVRKHIKSIIDTGISGWNGKWSLDRCKKMLQPGVELSQPDLDMLSGVVKAYFKAYTSVNQFKLSKHIFTILHNLTDGSRMLRIPDDAQRELDAMNLKPEKPIVVYRGVTFDSKSLQNGDGFGERYGLEFLKQVREGSRTAVLKFDDVSAWTTSKATAINWATERYNASWRKEASDRKRPSTTDALAFVVSTHVQPKDVLFSMQRSSEEIGYPSKTDLSVNNIFLKKGEYVARIVHKFVQSGEVDPTEGTGKDSLDELKDAFDMFSRVLKVKDFGVSGRFQETEDIYRLAFAQPAVRDAVKYLLTPGTREVLGKMLNSTASFYHKTIEPHMANDLAGSSGTNASVYKAVEEFKDLFGKSFSHDDYEPNVRGRIPSVQAKDMRQLADILTSRVPYPTIKPLAERVLTQKRGTDWGSMHTLQTLARIVDPSINVTELHRKGWAVQKPVVDKAVEGFFKMVGEPVPSTNSEIAKKLLEIDKNLQQLIRGYDFLMSARRYASLANA